MYDKRQPIKNGSIISYNKIQLRITELLGRGGNALVYKAEYDDSLIRDGVHLCIVKELFPYHPMGGIYRDEEGFIRYNEDAAELFKRHKQSFIHGNEVHLNLLRKNPDSVGVNFDSFEKNNTIYSVLGMNSTSTLRQRSKDFKSLSEILQITIKLLKAVRVFHENNILHLDISPDNIILSPSNGEERVLLIDFNSSCDGEKVGYTSVNPAYSAPEQKLGNGELSEAADIFSICAVLVYLISGEDFVYALTRLDRLAKAKPLDGITQPAVSCLLGMLAKGLRAKPSLRFKSAAEMLDACYELQNRIDNIGITHASLWEISRRLCGEWDKEFLDNNLKSGERLIPSSQLFTIGNTVITGEGGIGKTTLYKQLWHSHTRIYKPSEPVYFFVPLYQYDGHTDFIRRYIVSKAKFGGGISTVSDAVQKLTELMNNNAPLIYLMIDGFNEISPDKGNIIREIRELGKMPGVVISVSARTDTITEYLKNFTAASLMPLDSGQIREYLNRHSIAYPEDEELVRLLTNPLMLTLFEKTEEVFQKSGEVSRVRTTREEIMSGYLESLLEACKQSAPEDIERQLRLSYVLNFLFPALCAAAKKRTVLDFNTVREICKRDLRRMKSRAFSRAFQGCAGRAKEILGGAGNTDEWMNTAFNEILVRDTALVINDNNTYYPMHMNFTEYSAKIHRQNMKRYRKAVLGLRIPVTAAVISVCLCVLGAAYYYMPGTHPIGKKEIRNNYEIMTTAAYSLSNVTQMTMNEENLIEQLEYNDPAKSAAVLKSIAKKLDTLGDAEVEIENLHEKAYRGLDVKRVEKILAMSAEHRLFQRDMFAKLEYALSPESIYTEADIEKELKYYKEYLSDYEKLMGYELCLLTRTISGRGGDVIKEAMKGRGNIVLSFNNALEIKTKDLENSVNSLELNLKSLEAKLGLIQGE